MGFLPAVGYFFSNIRLCDYDANARSSAHPASSASLSRNTSPGLPEKLIYSHQNRNSKSVLDAQFSSRCFPEPPFRIQGLLPFSETFLSFFIPNDAASPQRLQLLNVWRETRISEYEAGRKKQETISKKPRSSRSLFSYF